MTKHKVADVRPMEVAWIGLDALDRQLFTQMSQIVSTFEHHAATVWGLGFRPDHQPMLLVRNAGSVASSGPESSTELAYGYAINIADPLALGSSIQLVPLPDELGLPPVYRFGSELANGLGLTPDDPAQFACEIDSQDCLAVSYDWEEAHAASWEFARFLVHEAFHQYQMFEATWRVPQGYDPSIPYLVDSIDSELATREMWYLEAAVTQLEDEGAMDLARSFLDVRLKRHARRSDLIVLEQGHEQIEGGARYVENLFASLNGRPLRLPVPTVNEVDYHEFASIGRYYRTGARVMELLDRTKQPWRHLLSEGLDPVSILTECLGRGEATDPCGLGLGPELDLTERLDLTTPVQPAAPAHAN